ncbi:MAG: hypothetical protein M0D55_11760 [Elusimicrobiota bacterium]|nr:MAG: hypothetical protein M0D55_11760 [Elusimicrobiota bacterium]
MSRKNEGMFATLGRAADESVGIADAIRSGRLTRSQFDAWYARRRAEGSGIVVKLRERATEMSEPLGRAVGQAERLAMAVAPPMKRRRRAVRRRTGRRSTRRATR